MRTISDRDERGDLDVKAGDSLLPTSSPPKKNIKNRKRLINNVVRLPKKDTPVCNDVPKGVQNVLGLTMNFRGKWIIIAMLSIVFGIQMLRAFLLRKSQYSIYETIVAHDYAHVNSITDLSDRYNLVSEKCYPGRAKKCTCADPIEGSSREGRRHWSKTSHENVDYAKDISNDEVDVVFYGDSIIEGWKGTNYGFDNGRKKNNFAEYEHLFTINGGGKYEGLVLGISGDTSGNLLWRLQHGELPSSLNPRVFWLLIGTNDIGTTWCSPEITLIGILRVVEELRAKKPGSTIVINGLLPMSYDKNGYVTKKRIPVARKKDNPPAVWQDFLIINNQLKEYSDQHEGVEYFDASDIFFVDKTLPANKLQIDKKLMNDFLHPSTEGYRIWGERIVKKLDQLIRS